jgi:DNA polymerase
LSSTLSQLAIGLKGCALCPLGKTPGERFFGRGPVKAPILLVVGVPERQPRNLGNFLTEEEERLLSAIITKGLKLEEDEVYVTPIVKCARQVEDFLPPQTAAVCRNITLKEIKLAAPKVVVSFGREAASILTKEDAVLDPLRRKKSKRLDSGLATAPLRMTIGLDSMLEFPELKKEAWTDLKEALKILKDETSQ